MLRSWLALIQEQGTEHLSLHFSGVRVGSDRVEQEGDVSDFCVKSMSAIKARSGFDVRIVESVQKTFLEFVHESQDQEAAPLAASEKVLLADGNCISLATFRCGALDVDVKARDEQSSENTSARLHKARAYRACQEEYGVCFTPCVGLNLDTPGKHLIHLQMADGRPHCVMVTVPDDREICIIYDKETCYRIPVKKLKCYAHHATDRPLLVSFQVGADIAAGPHKSPYLPTSGVKTLDGLLDLQAGAGAQRGLRAKSSRKSGAHSSTSQQSRCGLPSKIDGIPKKKTSTGASSLKPRTRIGAKKVVGPSPKIDTSASRQPMPTGTTSRLSAPAQLKKPAGVAPSDRTTDCVTAIAKTQSSANTPTSEVEGQAREASTKTPPEAGAPTTEVEIHVHDAMLHIMQRELQEYLDTLDVKHLGVRKPRHRSCKCHKCPFRSFTNEEELKEHCLTDHTADVFYIASGTKQLKVAMALYDDDQIRQRPSHSLLERSADVIRSTVKPGLSGERQTIDRVIVMAFHTDGPIYLNEKAVAHSLDYRRVGSTYYSREFATLVIQETIISGGLVKPMVHRLAMIFTQKGSALVSLLLTDVEGWLKVLEDIMYSPFVKDLNRDLKEECYQHNDFIHLSMDATVRLMRRVRGQEDYRCSKARRNSAPIPDSAAKRRILTILSRTGAAVGFVLVADESSGEVVRAVTSVMDPLHMQQVQAVSLDDCSAKLFQALKEIFPGLKYMMLDTVHPAITYEHCFYKKKTPGSKLLRVIMHKFNKTEANGLVTNWGSVFDGTNAPRLSVAENNTRDQILCQNMPDSKAKLVLGNLDPETPWQSTGAFIDALAALTATYQKEVVRKSHAGGQMIKRLLFNLAAPSRMQWYFNIMRFRHSLDGSLLALMGSGTGQNESAHMILNRASKNQPEWYQTTAELQFHTAQIAKIVAHNCAAYYPTLRQLTHATVLHRKIATLEYPPHKWEEFCKELCVGGRSSVSAAHLPLHNKRQAMSRKIKLHNLQKRPAADVRVQKTHLKKRTVFTLKRMK